MTIENLKLTNELVGTPASLIRSPLLQPMDGAGAAGTSNSNGNSTLYDVLDRDYEDMDFELEMSLDTALIGRGASVPMMTIPRSVIGKDRSSQEFVNYSDHTAEDNYKLWLNYNLTD